MNLGLPLTPTDSALTNPVVTVKVFREESLEAPSSSIPSPIQVDGKKRKSIRFLYAGRWSSEENYIFRLPEEHAKKSHSSGTPLHSIVSNSSRWRMHTLSMPHVTMKIIAWNCQGMGSPKAQGSSTPLGTPPPQYQA
uniref:Uncharacterized protein n=1 Tax=Nelumbo nucifera TaxID=4432 RepID=A0A822YVP5_NELNU|nr:TPA_asm: hypothetical protein HUJ06_005456 [Nelumbo nucifera]